MTENSKTQYFYTSGVFDCMHIAHVDSLMRMISVAHDWDAELLIGVCTDAYTESFKRTPLYNFEERFNQVKTVFERLGCRVIQDPLKDVNDKYTEEFYDSNNIIFHIQGGEFPENSSVYEVMTRRKRMKFIGRSTLMSTSEIINRIKESSLKKLGGDTNSNFLVNNCVVKKIENGNPEWMDEVYPQLIDKNLFKVKFYHREGNTVFLPYIEGEVRLQDITCIRNMIHQIHSSGLQLTHTIHDLFAKFNYEPSNEYQTLFLGEYVPSHADLVYINVINHRGTLIPIDFECTCMAPKQCDIASYLVSAYIYDQINADEVIDNTDHLERLACMMYCDYWLQWSVTTGKPYFNNKLKELKEYLSPCLEF
jgi:glycerol-3-phosphate cytidylyltransferase-like family protein